MLGSSHDGEVLNAARHAQRLVKDSGSTWEQVLTSNINGKSALALAAENDKLKKDLALALTNRRELLRALADITSTAGAA